MVILKNTPKCSRLTTSSYTRYELEGLFFGFDKCNIEFGNELDASWECLAADGSRFDCIKYFVSPKVFERIGVRTRSRGRRLVGFLFSNAVLLSSFLVMADCVVEVHTRRLFLVLESFFFRNVVIRER